ncbi:expressed unknown protein [Seminavis robusta]|uniref:Uncharacterized protein n=1 Tax=Seminavis robusta TaxID=568900 RepID=A0A9N8E0W2_9STRA|nr:expressed unknown protein [Seminavis robusta]|eukprot:Sro425_g140130.1 n/a (127) ;mRNA; f:28703-29083
MRSQLCHLLLSLAVAFGILSFGHGWSLPITTTPQESSSRRAFVLQQAGLLVTASSVAVSQPANAYGESEPGAKARKKAAQERKNAASASSSSSNKPSSPTVQADDLKGALGDFSYGSSSSTGKSKK